MLCTFAILEKTDQTASDAERKGVGFMSGNLIITIGRQSGSGGKKIGEMLAEKLGVKCYDKELLAQAAKHSGLCEELFEKHDERPTSSFLYSLVMDSYSMGYTSTGYSDMPINHKIFLAQFDTIKKLADEGSCVFIGCCRRVLEETLFFSTIFAFLNAKKTSSTGLLSVEKVLLYYNTLIPNCYVLCICR